MCIYIYYIYMYINIYVYIYIYLHIHIYTDMTYKVALRSSCPDTPASAQLKSHIQIHMYICIYIHIYIHTYIYIYIHIFIHIYIAVPTLLQGHKYSHTYKSVICHKYKRVSLHIQTSHVTLVTLVKLVTHTNESFHMYEWVTSCCPNILAHPQLKLRIQSHCAYK